MTRRLRVTAGAAALLALLGCEPAPPPDDAGRPDAPRLDGGARPDVRATPMDAPITEDGGPPTITGAEVLFEGTELDLSRHYGMYIQDDRGSIDVVDDPLGIHGDVIRFRHPKDADWAHTMVRPLDRRTDYEDAAQVRSYESVYHYRQSVLITADPQWTEPSMNLLEDFHCEPCEANSLQLFLNYAGDGSVCWWVAFSEDPDFDPRGANRGGDTDPWEVISPNRTTIWMNDDGTPGDHDPIPDTGSLLLCREDLDIDRLFGRWVDVEMIVRPSSYDTGVLMLWIDGEPYFYDGPNNYRWNQDDVSEPLPVNTFQIGLYGSPVDPADGAASYFEIFTTPPRIEIGTGIAGR